MTKNWNGKTLHVNGTNDPLTSLEMAQAHAKGFKNDTFFIYEGDHYFFNNKSINAPIKKFMQKFTKVEKKIDISNMENINSKKLEI